MSNENVPPDSLGTYLKEIAGKKGELVNVGNLEEAIDYEISEKCVVEEFPSHKKVEIPAGWHFFIIKKYPAYIHLNLHGEGGSIQMSLGYYQKLPIRRKDK